MKKSLLTILAGDLFQGTRFRRGLFFFRFTYYMISFMHLPRTLAAWRRRALNIRDEPEMRLSRG